MKKKVQPGDFEKPGILVDINAREKIKIQHRTLFEDLIFPIRQIAGKITVLQSLQPFGLSSFYILLVLFLISDAGELFGQISLVSDEPVTVAFYDGIRPPADQRLHYFSINNFQSILSENIRPVSAGSEEYSYITSSGGAAYAGKANLINVPGVPFTGFSIKNQSENDFEEIEFIFDFLSVGEVSSNSQYLRLIYRKNEGSWIDVSGGQLSLSSFKSDGEQATVSLQLMMNDLFVSSEDVVDFVWISDYDLSVDFPIYLQQLKMMPLAFSPASLQKGDLVITEIMPQSEIDGHGLEYLEIYNPSEMPLSLKGMTIETESGSLIIDKDFILPGYQIGIVSNADLSELEQVTHSYFYNGEILPSENGRINLLMGGTLLASATYGTSENNRSLELIETGYAADGYTSMQHLEVSGHNFFGSLWGSPGEFGRTLPLFKKEYTRQGTYLISVPGKLKGAGDRYSGLAFFTLDGTRISSSEIQPYEPVIMHKESSEPIVLIADGINLTGHQSDIFTSEHGNFQFLIPTNPAHYNFGSTIIENRNIIPPVYGEWNSRLNKFDLVLPSSITDRDSWSPLVTSYIHNDANGQRRNSDQIRQSENNLWLFSLSEPDNRSSGELDEIAVGFSESSVFTEGVPKALIRNESGRARESHPALYVSNSEASARANSFIQLGTDLTDKKEIVVGVDESSLTNPLQAEIRWNLPDIIPEDWILTLKDPATGSEIDMRQQNRYRFRMHPPENQIAPDNEAIRFQQAASGEVREFIVSMTPRMLTQQREEVQEIPGTIELRQNYPNPFNPTTNIAFFLPEERQVKLGIFNIVGQQVASLIEDNLQPGEHSIVWDASNSPSGIYIVQLESGSRTLTRKITLVK